MLIKVLPFNSHSITHLEEILIKSPEGPEGGDELGADLMLFRFLIWKLKKLDCKNIVVERNYLDRDFSEDYSSYYSGTFIDTGKYCVRLHFFKAHDFSGPLPFGDDKDREKIRTYRKFIQEAYCGFIVVLPTLRGVIGRTVITPSFGLKYENYCTTKASTKVNLEGVSLTICGAPFIQQDAPVGVCASTAIWITSRILQLLYQFPRYSLSRITEAANKYIRINRTFPATRGLTVEQIISGLIELGYTPLVYQKHTFHERDSWNPKEIIYKYVESGLPAIVVVGGIHACVVIGHNFNPNMKFETGKTETVISNSAFIDSFIVHDDALGPYLVMPEQSKVSPGGHKYAIERKLNPFEDNPEIYTPYSINDINCIIIPIFKKVYLEGQEIEDMIRHILEAEDSIYRRWYGESLDREGQNQLSEKTLKTAAIFREILEQDNGKGKIFYRTRFLLSDDFKEDYLLIKGNVPAGLSEIYSKLSLPRYIWLAELSFEEDVRKPIEEARDHTRQIIGEIVIDATSIEEPVSIAAVHFPGYVITNILFDETEDGNGEGDVKIWSIHDDCAYESFDRSRLDACHNG